MLQIRQTVKHAFFLLQRLPDVTHPIVPRLEHGLVLVQIWMSTRPFEIRAQQLKALVKRHRERLSHLDAGGLRLKPNLFRFNENLSIEELTFWPSFFIRLKVEFGVFRQAQVDHRVKIFNSVVAAGWRHKELRFGRLDPRLGHGDVLEFHVYFNKRRRLLDIVHFFKDWLTIFIF